MKLIKLLWGVLVTLSYLLWVEIRAESSAATAKHQSATESLDYVTIAWKPGGSGDAQCPKGCQCEVGGDLDFECQLTGTPSNETIDETVAGTMTGAGLTLHCSGDTPPNANILPHPDPQRAAAITAIDVRNCAAPREGWAILLHTLGIQGVTHVRLRQPPTLSSADVSGIQLQSLTLENAVDGLFPLSNMTLPTLRRLSLRGGNLELNAVSFTGMVELSWLELADVNLRKIPGDTLSPLQSLRRLGLWGNGLTTLEGLPSNLTELMELDVSSNPLKSLSGLPKSLVRVRVGGGGAALVLEGSELADRVTLLEVSLSRCSLTSLPPNLFFGSPSIVNVSLAQNRLSAIPPELFRDQTALERLDLSDNRITRLDATLLKPLRSLIRLNLNDNLIEELPNGMLATLKSLQDLSVARCRIRRVSSDGLRGAESLRKLDLSGNQLALCAPISQDSDYLPFGPTSPFASLTSLQTLSLAHNRILGLCSDWSLTMTRLESLDLSYNNITAIDESELSFTGPTLVDLRHNNISTVRLASAALLFAMDGGDSRATVQLGNNPLNCNCEVVELWRRLKHTAPGAARLDVDGLLCATPTELRGKEIITIDGNALMCDVTPPDCPAACSCALKPIANELELSCNSTPSHWPSPQSFGVRNISVQVTSSSPELRLDAWNLSADVRTLSASGLQLSSVSGEPPTTLKLLDLRNNALKTLSTDLLRHNMTVMLTNNSFTCDCDHSNDLYKLSTHIYQIPQWDSLKCEDGETVRSAVKRSLCSARYRVWAVVVVAILGAVAAAATIVWRQRRTVRAWLWVHGAGAIWKQKDTDNKTYTYDAFISHCVEDAALAEQLGARLENRGASLCMRGRDWLAGHWVPAQVAASLAASRRTIVLVSTAWEASPAARAEWRAAITHGRPLVVLCCSSNDLTAPDAELAALIAAGHCYSMSDPLLTNELLWELRVRAQSKLTSLFSRIAPPRAEPYKVPKENCHI